MSDETTKGTEGGKEEAKTEGALCCPCMPSGELPACCGPEMKGMMSRFMGQFRAKEAKQG